MATIFIKTKRYAPPEAKLMLGQKNELVEPVDDRFIPDYQIDGWLATDFNQSLLIGGQFAANCQTFIN